MRGEREFAGRITESPLLGQKSLGAGSRGGVEGHGGRGAMLAASVPGRLPLHPVPAALIPAQGLRVSSNVIHRSMEVLLLLLLFFIYIWNKSLVSSAASCSRHFPPPLERCKHSLWLQPDLGDCGSGLLLGSIEGELLSQEPPLSPEVSDASDSVLMAGSLR